LGIPICAVSQWELKAGVALNFGNSPPAIHLPGLAQSKRG